jgi:hypothetical protein
MNVYGQGVNGMGVYPMLPKQETDNLVSIKHNNKNLTNKRQELTMRMLL